MGTKNKPGEYDCYEHAGDDEPIFTLRAKDVLAPNLVRRWARRAEREGLQPREKIEEARRCASAMAQWYKENRDASTA